MLGSYVWQRKIQTALQRDYHCVRKCFLVPKEPRAHIWGASLEAHLRILSLAHLPQSCLRIFKRIDAEFAKDLLT